MRKVHVCFASLALALALLAGVAPVSAAPAAVPKLLGAVLSGANAVPGPGDPDGRGVALILLAPARGQVCFQINVVNITLPAMGAHIHQGAAGVSGPIVVTLAPPAVTGMSRGCASASASTIDAIETNPRGYYVNVHNMDFPVSAVRGQLMQLRR